MPPGDVSRVNLPPIGAFLGGQIGGEWGADGGPFGGCLGGCLHVSSNRELLIIANHRDVNAREVAIRSF